MLSHSGNKCKLNKVELEMSQMVDSTGVTIRHGHCSSCVAARRLTVEWKSITTYGLSQAMVCLDYFIAWFSVP